MFAKKIHDIEHLQERIITAVETIAPAMLENMRSGSYNEKWNKALACVGQQMFTTSKFTNI